jgi:hypothetical protein
MKLDSILRLLLLWLSYSVVRRHLTAGTAEPVTVVTVCDPALAHAHVALLRRSIGSRAAGSARGLNLFVFASATNGDHTFWREKLACMFQRARLSPGVRLVQKSFDPSTWTPMIWPSPSHGGRATSLSKPYFFPHVRGSGRREALHLAGLRHDRVAVDEPVRAL